MKPLGPLKNFTSHCCVLLAILSFSLASCATKSDSLPSSAHNVIYQTDPLSRLLEGEYSGGRTTLGELKELGDFGLGTFSGYQGGEMLILRDVVHSIPNPDRSVVVKDPSIQIPFAMTTRFRPTHHLKIKSVSNYEALRSILDGALDPQKNYAILVEGRFLELKVQCVQPPAKPGLPFAEVAQVPAELSNPKAQLVGFKTVGNATGHNPSGYHFHALSSAGQGGHLLDLRSTSSLLIRWQEAAIQVLHP